MGFFKKIKELSEIPWDGLHTDKDLDGTKVFERNDKVIYKFRSVVLSEATAELVNMGNASVIKVTDGSQTLSIPVKAGGERTAFNFLDKINNTVKDPAEDSKEE